MPDSRLRVAASSTQLINKVMLDGKKSIAERIVYGALERVGEKTGRPPVEVLEQAIKAVTPMLEVRSPPRRRCELPGADRGARASRPHAGHPLAGPVRARSAARSRWSTSSPTRSSTRANQQGGAFKKKDDIYRMAQANKAFAHYRW